MSRVAGQPGSGGGANRPGAGGPGPVALVGSGEFLDVMAHVDRDLLSGRAQRAVFLPTAAAEEGDGSVNYWVELGTHHFERLGVEPVPLRVLDRADADREEMAALVEGAGLVYLSGGNPGYLAETLRHTLVWSAILQAWRTGAALAGCSAGACALSSVAEDVRARAGASRPDRESRSGPPGGPSASGAPGEGSSAALAAVAGVAVDGEGVGVAGQAAADHDGPKDASSGAGSAGGGLGVVPRLAVIPHYDRILEWVPDLKQRYLARVDPRVTVVGIDEDTALVSSSGDGMTFAVAGRQAVHVLDRDGTSTRYEAGSTFQVA